MFSPFLASIGELGWGNGMSGQDIVRGRREGMPMPKPKKPGGGGGLDMLLTLVAVVAIGACAYFGVSYWLSRAPTPSSTNPQPMVALVSDRADLAWTDADTDRCKRKARAEKPQANKGDAAFGNRTVTEGFAQLATMVECRITTKFERFCDPAERTALVAVVNDYLARLDMLNLGLDAQGAPMKVMGSMFGGEVAMGDDIYQMQKDATLTFMGGYHKRVVAAMKALARKGLVSTADFDAGLLGGIPERIAEMLDVKPGPNLCA